MSDGWETFEVFGDAGSAESLAGRLRVDGVPAVVECRSPVPGLLEGFVVIVPSRLAHRARWVRALAQSSDRELNFLATGKLPGGEDEKR